MKIQGSSAEEISGRLQLPKPQNRIRVGTASWSDPGFVADWYPKHLRPADRLAYYAEYFDLVEVNSTFYGMPAGPMVERWARITPSGFTFDVKLHRVLSRHAAPANSIPAGVRKGAETHRDNLVLTPQLEKTVAKAFINTLEPLRISGRMGSLLLQLSPAFSPRHHRLEELDDLFGYFAGWKTSVELRNRNWTEESRLEETLAYFRRRNLTWVAVDGPPDSQHFTVMPYLGAVTSPELAYMRLHGRDAKAFVGGRTVADRFDYQYSETELQEVTDRAKAMAAEARVTHVIFNNNSSNYAIIGASRTREILEGTPPVPLKPSRSITPEETAGQAKFGF